MTSIADKNPAIQDDDVVFDKRPSALNYIGQIFRYGFSLTLFKELPRLLLYYVINHVKGMTKVQIGKGSTLWPTVLLRNAEFISIGENTSINHHNILWAGRRSARICIGNNVMTGPNVHFIAFVHHIKDGIPMHEHFTEQDIIVEDNAWIGANVVVLAGSRIGEGTVVGSGAVVNGELPPHSICVGTPARAIRSTLEK